MSKQAMPSDPSKEGSPDPDEEARARKRFKIDYGDTVQVLVGRTEKEFMVHKHKLCSSDFFALACPSDRWAEGRDKIVRLPECDPEAFAVFVHWIYTNERDWYCMKDKDGLGNVMDMITAWALGHFLQAKTFRNAVIDDMIEKLVYWSHSYVHCRTLDYAWTITPATSTIRRLLSDFTLWQSRQGREDDFEDQAPTWPGDILLEAARRYTRSEAKEPLQPTIKNRCQYHEHDEGEGRCS